jgi:uncharacterized membrane protein
VKGSTTLVPASAANGSGHPVSRLYVLVLMLLAACTAAAPPDSDNRTADPSAIVVSAHTDRTIAALDETIRLTVSVTCPQHVQVHMPEIGALIAGLRIVDFGESSSLIDNRLVLEKWFDLRADMSGTYIIPSITVRAVDHDETREISTPQIFIKVGASSTRADNETMQDIIDIKPLAALPRDLRSILLVSGIAVLLLAAGLGAWLYIRKRKHAPLAEQKPAHVVACEQLDQLEREGLVERGVVQEYYVRLADIFRHYLQNRFAVAAVEQTTQELLRAVKRLPDMPDGAKNATRDFLLHADLVKFAKYRPEIPAIQKSRQQVRDIIDQTRDLQAETGQPDTPVMSGGVRQ